MRFSIADDVEARLREQGWDGPVHRISAATGLNTERLMWDIFNWLKEHAAGLEDEDAGRGEDDSEDEEHDTGAAG